MQTSSKLDGGSGMEASTGAEIDKGSRSRDPTVSCVACLAGKGFSRMQVGSGTIVAATSVAGTSGAGTSTAGTTVGESRGRDSGGETGSTMAGTWMGVTIVLDLSACTETCATGSTFVGAFCTAAALGWLRHLEGTRFSAEAVGGRAGRTSFGGGLGTGGSLAGGAGGVPVSIRIPRSPRLYCRSASIKGWAGGAGSKLETNETGVVGEKEEADERDAGDTVMGKSSVGTTLGDWQKQVRGEMDEDVSVLVHVFLNPFLNYLLYLLNCLLNQKRVS
jgi:hypothetical protein